VVMRVDGEAVTDREFDLFIQSLPEQMQQMAMTPEGRREIANQIVRMKVLEKEGRRLGAENDPDVALKMDFSRTNVFVEYAVRKIATTEGQAALRSEYEKEKSKFVATTLRHILIAYQGGSVPARNGKSPSVEEAMAKANLVEQKLKEGAPFAEVASAVSDDPNSAANGGMLGAIPNSALPPELQSTISALPPGGVSAPVRTQYGIHIIKVEDRKPQTFDEVKPMLERRAQQVAVTSAIERLQKQAKVEFDPRFFPEAGKPPRG